VKAVLPFVLLGAVSFASAQVTGASPTTVAPSSTVRLIDAATLKAMTALRSGKKVTITVDNRSVAYAPKLIGKMVYVPVKFFEETGQKVIWDGRDMRATVRSQDGPTKNSIEYDAKRGQRNFQPGPSMRPVYQQGRLWVPLASGLAAFSLVTEWVSTSNRLNVRTVR